MSGQLLLEGPDKKPVTAKGTTAGLLKVDLGESEVTLDVDTTGLATSAKQDTAQTALDAIKTDVDKIPSKGTAAMAGATPVTLATNDTQMAALIAAIAALTLATSDPTKILAITKSDATDLQASTPPVTKGIWVGVGGDVAVKYKNDSAATTIANVPSGTFIAGNFSRVMSTNTTASGILGFGD